MILKGAKGDATVAGAALLVLLAPAVPVLPGGAPLLVLVAVLPRPAICVAGARLEQGRQVQAPQQLKTGTTLNIDGCMLSLDEVSVSCLITRYLGQVCPGFLLGEAGRQQRDQQENIETHGWLWTLNIIRTPQDCTAVPR